VLFGWCLRRLEALVTFEWVSSEVGLSVLSALGRCLD
jgi:hypothetical protein